MRENTYSLSATESNQSIDDFPLPPGTPLHASFDDVHAKVSVPEFNRSFRFPSSSTISSIANSSKLDDPESVLKRLRHESNVLAARLAQKFTELDPAGCDSHYAHSSEQEKKSDSEALCMNQVRPQTSNGAVLLPRFPFGEFGEWDINREADDTESDGENLILPHEPLLPEYAGISYADISPRPIRKSSLTVSIPPHFPCGIAPPICSPTSKDFTVQNERDRILRETREASRAISNAGFDFGFGGNGSVNTVPLLNQAPSNIDEVLTNKSRIEPATADALLSPSMNSEANFAPTLVPDVEIEPATKTTILTIPSRLSRLLNIQPYTNDSIRFDQPCSPQSLQPFSPTLCDSGTALELSPPKSAPPRTLCFADAPDALRANQISNSMSQFLQNYCPSHDEKMSNWSFLEPVEAQPDIDYDLDEPFTRKTERRRRPSFWGKMKSSLLRKKKKSLSGPKGLFSSL